MGRVHAERERELKRALEKQVEQVGGVDCGHGRCGEATPSRVGWGLFSQYSLML